MNRTLSVYEEWAKSRHITSCRLVQYVGLGQPGAIDVSVNDVFAQIKGCLAEGFHVDWHEQDSRLYLCVQEPGCPMPPWHTVIVEEPIEDVDSIFREAGLGQDV